MRLRPKTRLLKLLLSATCMSLAALTHAAVAAGMDSRRELRKYLVQIPDSSVWISKAEAAPVGEIKPLPFLIHVIGQISQNDIPVFRSLLAPYLDKDYFKNHPPPSRYRPEPYEIGQLVDLDSDGGNVFAAMEIGRMFRKARVRASLLPRGKCLSACVLLLAGAVVRDTAGTVGIHRPFLNDATPTSYESLQARTRALGEAVSAYLKEMNMPGSLYDSMRLVPSDRIKVLTAGELAAFGLSGKDPAYAELIENAGARAIGLSKQEYLERKALAEGCVHEAFRNLPRDPRGEPDYSKLEQLVRDCNGKFLSVNPSRPR